MFRAALFASLALTIACGGDGGDGTTEEMSEADFKAAFETKLCDQMEVCTGMTCMEDDVILTDQAGCTYDASYASDCLDADFACDDGDPDGGVTYPLACESAYDCS